jgi:hypothetical protein
MLTHFDLIGPSNDGHYTDLHGTRIPVSLPCAGSALACTTAGGSDPRVYYLDRNPHVHELAYDGEAWHDKDLTNVG